jgi:hypothetical protein
MTFPEYGPVPNRTAGNGYLTWGGAPRNAVPWEAAQTDKTVYCINSIISLPDKVNSITRNSAHLKYL